MDNELKKYLDGLMDDLKKDMSTKDDIKRLDKKIEKGNKELLDYIALVDENLEKHRRNTEIHAKVGAHGF